MGPEESKLIWVFFIHFYVFTAQVFSAGCQENHGVIVARFQMNNFFFIDNNVSVSGRDADLC